MLRANLLFRGYDSPMNSHISTGKLVIYCGALCDKSASTKAHISHDFLIFRGKTGKKDVFPDLYGNRVFGILLQRGIAILDREAAALPGRFLPELGRSPERPFFFASVFWALRASRAPSWT